MSWFSDLAGKAENLLNNIDQGTATVLQNRTKTDVMYAETQPWLPRVTRRPLSKTTRKPIAETRTTYSPTRKTTPPIKQYPNLRYGERKEPVKSVHMQKKSNRKMYDPNRASTAQTVFCDDRMRSIDDDEIVMHDYGTACRRRSLPNSKDMEDMINRTHKLETLTIENQMLKNEMAGFNQEISELLDKLRIVEDDIKEADAKYENLEKLHRNVKNEKESLSNELTRMKETNGPGSEMPYSDLSTSYRALEQDFQSINDRNMELQKQLKEVEMSKLSNSSIQMKLENDLRFAHMTLSDLRADLEKSRNECQRVQSDWDAYKLRVKSMLISKDKELEALQKNPDFSEGTRMLAEQVEALREEREELSAAVTRGSGECESVVRRLEEAEGRTHAAERLVSALREALREERLVRNKAESQCIFNNKALKNLQMETSLQIADLHATLRDKETELRNHRAARMHSTTSICPVADGSALNVAECDRLHESISSEKVQLLTQSLIVKQGKIDKLMSENSTLKLHIEKIEAKYRQELSNLQNDQRIIQVSDGDALLKARIGGGSGYTANSVMGKISLRIGVFMRRHPIFRLFIILYMVGLHMWVMLVLLTYTPEVHAP